MKDFFDAIFVINLKRRKDRLDAFYKCITDKGWCFSEPIIFEAPDNEVIPCGEGWEQGGGAYCCRNAHCQIIEKALMMKLQTFLVLEDDAVWHSNFVSDCEVFLKSIPNDWQLLFLGGQHMRSAKVVSPGIVRCMDTQRTHAMGWKNSKMLKDVYSKWMGVNSKVHIDWQLGGMCKNYNVYAPNPFLIGQARSQSDINGRINPTKFFVPPQGNETIFLLNCSLNMVRELRDYGIHTGYDRDTVTDIDNGLLNVFKQSNKEQALKKWVEDLMWEVVSEEKMYLGVYHPDVTVEMLQKVWTGRVVSIHNVEELMTNINGSSSTVEKYIILLETKKSVVDKLRDKLHFGHWIDNISGVDNGLRLWAAGDVEWRLADIINTLVAEAGFKIPALWYPEFLQLQDVQSNTKLKVKVIKGNTVEEILKDI